MTPFCIACLLLAQLFRGPVRGRNAVLGGRVVALIITRKDKLSPNRLACDSEWFDIDSFRVQRIHPDPTGFTPITPQKWAACLVTIRQKEAARLDALWTEDPIF